MAVETEDFKAGFIEALVESGQTHSEAEEAWKEYLRTTVTKELILCNVTDLVSNFMYYDRKEDDDLPRGAIEKAIEVGVITLDEIVEKFRDEITENT